MMGSGLNDAMLRALQDAGQRAIDAAKAAAIAALLARLANIAPGVAVDADGDGVHIRARGLWARVFGSRRRGPDPRFQDLTGGDP